VGVQPHPAFYLYAQDAALRTTPGNVHFKAARNVVVRRNVFQHLGAIGLVFEAGAKDNVIEGNIFDDSSSGALRIGDIKVTDHHSPDPRFLVSGNQVRHNRVTRAGAEFLGSAGVTIGYSKNTVVESNELADLPYTGIHGAFGLGFHDSRLDGGVGPYVTPTIQEGLQIRNNLIHDYMNVLNDGGAIYLTGADPGTVVRGNALFDRYGAHGGALYLDQGARFVTAEQNAIFDVSRTAVIKGTPHTIGENFWHDRNPSDVKVVDDFGGNHFLDYYNTAASHTNQVVNDSSVMPASIINAAGPSGKFADLRLPRDTEREAPTAPGTPSANTTPASALGWEPATDNVGVAGYEIYRDGRLLGVSGTTSFTLHGAGHGCFTVRARDRAGNLSPAGDPACLQFAGAPGPYMPRPSSPVYLASSELQDGQSSVRKAFGRQPADGGCPTPWSPRWRRSSSPRPGRSVESPSRAAPRRMSKSRTGYAPGRPHVGGEAEGGKPLCGNYTITLPQPVQADIVRVIVQSSSSVAQTFIGEIEPLP
jgi:hypothetical protein